MDLGLNAEPIQHLVRELHQMVREILPSGLAQRMSSPIGLGGTVDNEQAISVTFRDTDGRYLIPTALALRIEERQSEVKGEPNRDRTVKVVTTATLVRQQMPEAEAFESVSSPVEVVIVDDRAASGTLKVHYLFPPPTVPREIFDNMISPGSTARAAQPSERSVDPEIQSLLLRGPRAAPPPKPTWTEPAQSTAGNSAFSLGRDLIRPLLAARLEALGVPVDLRAKLRIQTIVQDPSDASAVLVTHRVPYFLGRQHPSETVRAVLKIDPATGVLTAAIRS